MQVYKNAVFYRFWSRFPFFQPVPVFIFISDCLFWYLRLQNRQLLATKVASMDIPDFSDHIIRMGG